MRISTLRHILVGIVVATLTFGVLAASPSEAAKKGKRKPPTWASAASATIHPGVQTVTGGAQCTANFVFVDKKYRVYLGQAAHCGGAGEATDTNGCEAPAAKPGTPVQIYSLSGDVVAQGKIAYNSWFTMQRRGERNPDACQYNDFALIKLRKASVRQVNPSLPVFGGPTGLRKTSTTFGERLFTYGNSSLRFGITELSPKSCTSIGGDDWTHDHYCPNIGVPGDSGSAFVDADGKALGVLSTLNSFPPASNTATDLNRQLSYAKRFSGLKRLRLVKGTEPFNPSVVAQ